jgi:hypothetical protein
MLSSGAYPAAMRCNWRKYSNRSTPWGQDDQKVGVRVAGRGESVHRAGRNNDQVTLAHGKNALAGEHLGGAEYHVEQLARAGVMVGCGPGRPLPEGDPLAAERSAGGTAVGVQPAGHRRAADDFGISLAYEDHVVRWNRPGHTNTSTVITVVGPRINRPGGPGRYMVMDRVRGSA